MKRLLVVGLVIATSIVALAANPTPKKKGSGIPLAERKRMAQERMLRVTGGYVTKPGIFGKIVYVNGQTKVAKEVIEKQTKLMSDLLSINVQLIDGEGKFSLAEANAKRQALKANASIHFVDDPALGETMLVAPESCWAVVNVAALTKDSPDKAKLEKRLIRETWRSFAFLLGAANSNEPRCILRPVTKNADLDAMVSDVFCPEPLDKIVGHLKAIGVDASGRKTYRQACKEGWAPAPKDKYQQAIWDEFHQLPTKPVKIEFDPKAGK